MFDPVLRPYHLLSINGINSSPKALAAGIRDNYQGPVAQALVLAAIHFHQFGGVKVADKRGPSPSLLASWLALSRGRIAQVLRELEAERLITCEAAEDGRCKIIYLSDQGRIKAIAATRAIHEGVKEAHKLIWTTRHPPINLPVADAGD